MNASNLDLFHVWRVVLSTLCGAYATVVTVRSFWGWVVYLSGSDRRTSLMRNYVLVQLLRLRLGRFASEFAQIGAWFAVFVGLLYLHRF